MRIWTTLAVLLAGIGAAHAQYVTTPNIYGQPQYGVTTQGPGGVYRTEPQIYGQPQYGTRTTGPNGMSCTTTPNIYGQPQYGSRTTC